MLTRFSHYSPFGSCIQELQYAYSDAGDTSKYRFGFNGEERMDELSGEGMAYDLGARFYDGRLGRMFSVDPKQQEYPYWSPYSYACNTPIRIIDLMGLGPGDEKHGNYRNTSDGCTEYFDATIDGSGGIKGAWVDYNPNLKTYSKEDEILIQENNKIWATNYLDDLQTKIITQIGKDNFSKFKSEMIETVIELNKFPSYIENGIKQLGISEKTNCEIVKSYYNSLLRKGPTMCTGGSRNQSAWCASYVSFCLDDTEYGTTGDPGAYWWSETNRPKSENGALHATGKNWGYKVNDPYFGSICVFTSNSHVGILIGKTKTGQFIMLGGNQFDVVNLVVWGNKKLKTSYIMPNNFNSKVKLPIITTGFIDKSKSTPKTD